MYPFRTLRHVPTNWFERMERAREALAAGPAAALAYTIGGTVDDVARIGGVTTDVPPRRGEDATAVRSQGASTTRSTPDS